MRKSTMIKVIFVTMFMFFAMNALVMAQIYYNSSGNVGIGTTSPSGQLSLGSWNVGSAGIAGSYQLELAGAHNSGTNANGYKLYISGYDNDDTSYTYPIYVIDENEKVDFWLRSRSSISGESTAYLQGRVGIGTTSPQSKLHVEAGNVPGYSPHVYANACVFEHSDHNYIEIACPEGKVSGILFSNEDEWKGRIRYSHVDDSMRFTVNNNYDDAIAIINNGNVGIRTLSPNYELHVDGDIAYTGSIYDVSDIRLKENITPLEDAVKKVSAINAIYFNNIGEPENREVGVIAQEVETVLPEVVSEDDEGYKSVDYSKLTPLLIEAVKELKAENEALKARISTLEAAIQP